MENNIVIYAIMSILIIAFIFAYIDNKKIDREMDTMQKEIIEALKKENEALQKLKNRIKQRS
jgi:predicted Holliday junction resolvase-like endonuclease